MLRQITKNQIKLLSKCRVLLLALLSLITTLAHDRVLAGEIVPQIGHTQEINSLIFSHHGDFIVSAAADQKIKIWTTDGRLLRTIIASDFKPRIALSPDDRMILATGTYGNLELWSVDGKLLQRFPRMNAFMLWAIGFSPDMRYVVACSHASKQNYCQEFDLNGKPLATLDLSSFGNSSVNAIAVSPDGKFIYTATFQTVTQWRDTGEKLKTIAATPMPLFVLALSPDGTRLAAASWLGDKNKYSTYLWDADGKPVAEINSHSTQALAFSADSQWLLTGGDKDNRILIHDRDGHPVRTLSVGKGRSYSPAHFALSPDKQKLAIANHLFKPVDLRLYDSNGKFIRNFNQYTADIINIAMEASGRVILTTSADNQIRYWSLDGRLLKRFSAEYDYPTMLAVAPNSKLFITGGSDVTLWGGGGDKLARFTAHKVTGNAAAFSLDSKTLYTGGRDGYLNIIPLTEHAEALRVKPCGGKEISAITIHPSGKYIAVGSSRQCFSIVDTQGKVLVAVELPKTTQTELEGVQSVQFTPDGSLLAVTTNRSGREVMFYDMQGQEVFALNTGNRGSRAVSVISRDGRWLATPSNTDVGIWDLQTRTLSKLLKGYQNRISSLAFTPDARHVVSSGSDGTLRMWNVENGQAVNLLSNHDDWVMYTDDGYFDASRHGGDMVALVQANQAYSVDQVLLLYNRPDIIYERLDIGDAAFREHFRNQYEERLRRAGITSATPTTLSAPEVKITTQHQDNRQLSFTVEAADANSDLRSEQIYINDVPMFQGEGKPLSGHSTQHNEHVELSNGKNRVEVSVTNQLGIESLRTTLFAEYRSQNKAALYYIGMGVSQYKDSRLNLRFADRDITTLAATMRRYGKAFSDVHTLELTNAEANRGALDKIKQFLKPAGVDDTVIISVSGHGGYDFGATSNYYFLSYEAQSKDLANTAIAYNDLESLFTGIQPRRKLLLLDTCASGEIDAETLAQINEKASANKLTVRTIEPIVVSTTVSRRTYLLTRDRYIYNSPERRTGAIVFSSSLGAEASIESPALKNGIFTAAILRALTEPKADTNKDGYIAIDELESAVKTMVVTATHGLQHPTIDRDNIYQDFRLPLLR